MANMSFSGFQEAETVIWELREIRRSLETSIQNIDILENLSVYNNPCDCLDSLELSLEKTVLKLRKLDKQVDELLKNPPMNGLELKIIYKATKDELKKFFHPDVVAIILQKDFHVPKLHLIWKLSKGLRLEDAKRIYQIMAGNEEAWEILILKYAPKLSKYLCQEYRLSPEQKEEISRKTWLTAYRFLSQCDEDFMKWVKGIADNCAKKYPVRKKAKKTEFMN